MGDINGDGSPDVLLGDHTRRRAAHGSRRAVWPSRRRGAGLPDNVWFNGAGLADVNGDGNLDAFFGADQFSSGDHGLPRRWKRVVDGGHRSVGVHEQHRATLSFADYDGDGDLDVFAFGKSGPGVTAMVFRNDAGAFASVGQWTGGTNPTGADPLQGSVGDVDCDGRSRHRRRRLDLPRRRHHLVPRVPPSTPARFSQLADMDGDGNLDLVTHDVATGLALYLGDGTGTGWTLDESSGLPGPEDGIDSAYGIEIRRSRQQRRPRHRPRRRQRRPVLRRGVLPLIDLR